MAKARGLRKHEPHPVAALASSADFAKRAVITVALGSDEAGEVERITFHEACYARRNGLAARALEKAEELPMLEHVPRWLGAALRGARAGAEKIAVVQPELGGSFAALDLSSPAFGHEARLPERFTADGGGVSPPLVWGPLPEGTTSLALLVEDADAPAPQPLVHAVIWGMPADTHRIVEDAIRRDGDGERGGDVGRNSFFGEGWLPPDPPTGHGVHRYAFQLFALDQDAGDPGTSPGRGAIVKAMAGHVLAAGLLIGTYSRGEEKPFARTGSVQPNALG